MQRPSATPATNTVSASVARQHMWRSQSPPHPAMRRCIRSKPRFAVDETSLCDDTIAKRRQSAPPELQVREVALIMHLVLALELPVAREYTRTGLSRDIIATRSRVASGLT
jgi:hypothetical protein